MHFRIFYTTKKSKNVCLLFCCGPFVRSFIPTFDSCVSPPFPLQNSPVCLPPPFVAPPARWCHVIETIIINSLVLRSTHLSLFSSCRHYNEVITLCLPTVLSGILHWFQRSAMLSSIPNTYMYTLLAIYTFTICTQLDLIRCYWPAGRLVLSVCFGFSYFHIIIDANFYESLKNVKII